MDFQALLNMLLQSGPVSRAALNGAGAVGGIGQAAGGALSAAKAAVPGAAGPAAAALSAGRGLAGAVPGMLGGLPPGMGTGGALSVAGSGMVLPAVLGAGALAGKSLYDRWSAKGQPRMEWGGMPWDQNYQGGALGNLFSGIGTAVHGTPQGGQAAQGIKDATQGPADAVAQATGQPPVSNPGRVPAQGQGLPAENASVQQQKLERNQTVGRGGKAGMAELLQEKGMNPYFSGNMYSQSLMNNADALTLQSKLEGAMHPGTPAEQSFSDVANRVLNNQGAYFDQPTAQRVYGQAADQARKYQENPAAGAIPELLAELLFGENSAPNVAQLLYGTSTGALGAAQQNSVLQQSERGKYMYRHPDQYNVPQNHLGFLDIYNNAVKR